MFDGLEFEKKTVINNISLMSRSHSKDTENNVTSANIDEEPEEFKQKKELKNTSRMIYKKLFTDPLALVAILPTMLAGGCPFLCSLALSNVMQALTDYFADNSNDPFPAIYRNTIYLGVIAVVTGFCNFVQTYFWTRVGIRMSIWAREMSMNSLMRSDVGFFDVTSIGKILTILGEDTAVIQESFGNSKGIQLRSIGQYLIAVVICLVYCWQLGLILIAVTPVGYLVMYFAEAPSNKWLNERFLHIANSNTIAEETLSNIRVVRGCDSEGEEKKRFAQESKLGTDAEKKSIMYILGTEMACFCIYLVACDGSMYYAASMVANKSLSAGSYFAATFVMILGCAAIIPFQHTVQTEQRAIQAGVHITNLVSYQPPINFEGGEVIGDLKGHIEFKNVSFKYPTRDVYALKDVSFEVRPGEMGALVGHSGSGKSTCVQLLERFYDVTEGSILIDGHNIKDLDPRWLHRQIGLVGQEPTLFQGSVRSNVLYGVKDKESKTDEDIWAALESAHAKKFVQKMDKQLETIVGDKGSALSGGQRQRLAIARALIKDPVIMVTDEATSALDSASEKKVQAALDTILANKTSIVVAHRLSTVQNAHLIHVFEEGKIIEEGTHSELVAKRGAYYNLVRRQLKDEEQEL